jgi:hypothetical protein
MRSWRNAARKVVVFQWPHGILPTSRSPARGPAMGARHIGFDPSLIDEYEPRGINPALIFTPLGTAAAYVRTVLLARHQRLFLSVILSRRKKRLNIRYRLSRHGVPTSAARVLPA